jgi:DNA-binding NarL/FixJ family response regulator
VSRLVPATVPRREPAAGSPAELLSDRELEVFRLLGQGTGTRKIATLLGVAPSTVESYRVSIKRKLHIDNATELIARAANFVTEARGAGSVPRAC